MDESELLILKDTSLSWEAVLKKDDLCMSFDILRDILINWWMTLSIDHLLSGARSNRSKEMLQKMFSRGIPELLDYSSNA